MNVEYESVVYGSGNVARNTPKGFANLYYDNVPSPLTVQGGGTATLLGEGGVLDGLESIFGNVAGGSAFGSVGGFLGTAISAVNTAKNIGKLSSAGIRSEVVNILSSPAAVGGIINSVGGVIGSVFPRNNGGNTDTQATQRSIIPGSGV